MSVTDPLPHEPLDVYTDRILGPPGSTQRRLGGSETYSYWEQRWWAAQPSTQRVRVWQLRRGDRVRWGGRVRVVHSCDEAARYPLYRLTFEDSYTTEIHSVRCYLVVERLPNTPPTGQFGEK